MDLNQASQNATEVFLTSPSSPTHYPFYYISRATVIPGISDEAISLAAPVIAYWILSLVFHLLDTSGWNWLDKYRLHESEELTRRNTVTRAQVIKAVLIQQTFQTLLGVFWMTEDSVQKLDHVVEMQRLVTVMGAVLAYVIDDKAALMVLNVVGEGFAYYAYWWFIPIVQVVFAAFIMDTWQYFIHRTMHANKFLYKKFHSVHHRLYIPFAFGALYNHPIEGLLVDSLGAVISEAVAGLTVRQAGAFFVFATLKAVDDHCGYSLPWDPLQLMSGNTSEYHDIHHRGIGIKSNFSQPFFVHWDALLGTRMTREDIAALTDRSRKEN